MNVSEKKNEINSKGELYLFYSKISRVKKQNAINRIISEVRGITFEDAKPKKDLRPKEVRLFKEEFDETYF